MHCMSQNRFHSSTLYGESDGYYSYYLDTKEEFLINQNYLSRTLRRKVTLNYLMKNIERGKRVILKGKKSVFMYPVETSALIRSAIFLVLFTSLEDVSSST